MTVQNRQGVFPIAHYHNRIKLPSYTPIYNIIVIFWTTCIAGKFYSVVVMGNGKYALPVLHCHKEALLLFLVCHIFTAHAQKQLCISFVSKFWHRHWIQRPRFPIRQGYFCNRWSFAINIKFVTSDSLSVGTRVPVLDKILDRVLE